MITEADILQAWGQVQHEAQGDPTLVPHLYVDQGLKIAQIAAVTGLHRSTVYRRLTAAGVYRGRGKGGPPRQEKCGRGHSMAEHARTRPDGSRLCTECKRERERVRVPDQTTATPPPTALD